MELSYLVGYCLHRERIYGIKPINPIKYLVELISFLSISYYFSIKLKLLIWTEWDMRQK